MKCTEKGKRKNTSQERNNIDHENTKKGERKNSMIRNRKTLTIGRRHVQEKDVYKYNLKNSTIFKK